jgi:hypothetical protein
LEGDTKGASKIARGLIDLPRDCRAGSVSGDCRIGQRRL